MLTGLCPKYGNFLIELRQAQKWVVPLAGAHFTYLNSGFCLARDTGQGHVLGRMDLCPACPERHLVCRQSLGPVLSADEVRLPQRLREFARRISG